MKTSQVIAKYLTAAHIEFVFGYPGDPTVELLEALRQDDVRFVLGSREGTTGLMAEAYGQLTGRPGVCVSTLGPGSSNLVNAVASAYLDRVPMIAISGQIESRREPYFTHQVIDHARVFPPISKWATSIQPETVGTIMRKALRVAMAERPGPVHLSTPGNVIGAEAIDDQIALPPISPQRGIQVFSRQGAHRDPVERIRTSRRPIILAGMSAAWSQAGESIVKLSEALGCPVVVSPMAKGIIPEEHPFYAGTLDMACNGYIWEFLRRADLLLTIGFDAVELIKPWTLNVNNIHIDTVANTDQIYEAETEIIGDISAILHDISESAGKSERWSAAEMSEHRSKLSKLYYQGRVRGRLNPTDVIDVVRQAVPHDAIISTDVGSHKLLVGQGWTTYEPGTVLMTNGLSSMGYALPASITAKLVHPRTPVVCFVGDGGLAMTQAELRTAASLKRNPLIIVFCDNSLNRIELKQRAKNYPSFGTIFDSCDYVALARSMGCEGVSVDSSQYLESVLAESHPADRPLLVAAEIDPSQYAAQF
ncbi:MAG: thiamine pyrophosphate-binding protein [Candidatus Acidiferrales bacterium]